MFFKNSLQPADESSESTKKRNAIHWRMPTAMAVCWIIGLGLALGHHFYYFSLDGTVVPGRTQQEWSSRVGTGLAFLTKTFLTTAVGIALVQNVWWILRIKPVRLSTLDSMWDIRGNIFNFFDPHVWLRGPNVAILGLISWCIPLVTVVTPSTLSIEPTLATILQEHTFPVIDYNFDKFYTMTSGGPTGPTASISRFITGAVITGTIPTIPAPAPNSSYDLTFTGPLIQCSNSSANISQQVFDWARDNYQYETSFLGFTPNSDNISYAMHDLVYDSYQGPPGGDRNADIAGKLIMAIWPYMPLDERWVIECGIYNASWSVGFNYTNGAQTTSINNLTTLNRVHDYRQHKLPKPDNEDQLFAYTAMLKAFRDALEGRCISGPTSCTDTQVFSSALVGSKQIFQMVFDNQKVGDTGPDDLPSILDVVGELGRNITVGFWGEEYFLNANGPTQNITTHQTQTIYIYSQRNLLLAYGLSVFISLLCIIAGLLTMYDNGMAFTDSLSTILRATRNPLFDEIVPAEDRGGADPGPDCLARTRVVWVASGSGNGERDGERSKGEGEGVAGLKPLKNEDSENGRKGDGNGSGSDNEGTELQSSTSFTNRIWERKSRRPTVSRVDTADGPRDGFI